MNKFYDYDNCEYCISRTEDDPDVLKLAFRTNCFDQLMENGGKDMLDELYADSQLTEDRHIPGYNITLGIDAANIL